MAVILKLFVGDGRGFGRLNQALITLIPKKEDATLVGDFRPISLVHSFSKLFSKLLANILKFRLGELVGANQSAFVIGRCLHDNFILVRQLARNINSRREKGVLIKLDLTRAFDSISWAFLFEVLRGLGFGHIFLRLCSVVRELTPGEMNPRRGWSDPRISTQIHLGIESLKQLNPQHRSLIPLPCNLQINYRLVPLFSNRRFRSQQIYKIHEMKGTRKRDDTGKQQIAGGLVVGAR
jgi:hypothetical protein